MEAQVRYLMIILGVCALMGVGLWVVQASQKSPAAYTASLNIKAIPVASPSSSSPANKPQSQIESTLNYLVWLQKAEEERYRFREDLATISENTEKIANVPAQVALEQYEAALRLIVEKFSQLLLNARQCQPPSSCLALHTIYVSALSGEGAAYSELYAATQSNVRAQTLPQMESASKELDSIDTETRATPVNDMYRAAGSRLEELK
jgi:hypothetical protein